MSNPLKWLVREASARRRDLFLVAIFDTLVGILLLSTPFATVGGVSAEFRLSALLAGSHWIWGGLFLSSGILAVWGLWYRGITERIAISLSTGLAAGRAIGLAVAAAFIWPSFAGMLGGAALVWARMAISLWMHSDDAVSVADVSDQIEAVEADIQKE